MFFGFVGVVAPLQAQPCDRNESAWISKRSIGVVLSIALRADGARK